MTKILHGKPVADYIMNKTKRMYESTPFHKIDTPTLLVISGGDDFSSQKYINNKIKFGEKIGFKVIQHIIDESLDQDIIESLVSSFGRSDHINGIIVQLPLPDKYDSDAIINKIPWYKDVDGLTSKNMHDVLTKGKAMLEPCTPRGIMHMIDYYGLKRNFIDDEVLMIGRSKLVGLPLSMMLMHQFNSTVTIAHSKTNKNEMKSLLKNHRNIISATGNQIDISKRRAILIDCGIRRDENNKVIGDFNINEDLWEHGIVTPVPGGVGLTTVATLFENLVIAFNYQHSHGLISKENLIHMN